MSVSVRRANLQDYDDVMAITGKIILYNGFDYLPRQFHAILTSHGGGHVVEVDGQVVGFVAFALTDDGRSFTARAGRVHPDFQKRGLFKLLQDKMTEDLIASHPTINSRKMAIDASNPKVKRLMDTHNVLCSGRKFLFCPLDQYRKEHLANIINSAGITE